MTPPPGAASAAARQPVRTTRPAPRPRRISGPAHPARPARKPVAVPRRAPRELPFGARVLDGVRALPDHRLLDRLIGGRIWIALIGTLLVGIVTLQLSLLKLNAGISRAVEHSSVLEQGNAALAAEVSRLSDPQLILDAAAREGFVTPLQGTPRFRTASASDARRALSVMRVPQQSATTAIVTTPVSEATTTTDAAATTTDPTAAAGTMTTVPSTTTTDQTATSGATTTAPVAPSAPTDAATTAGTIAAGGAAAPQG